MIDGMPTINMIAHQVKLTDSFPQVLHGVGILPHIDESIVAASTAMIMRPNACG